MTSTPPDQMVVADSHQPRGLSPEALEGRVSDDGVSSTGEADSTTMIGNNAGTSKLDVPTLTMTQATPIKSPPNTQASLAAVPGGANSSNIMGPPATQQPQRGSRTKEQVEKDLHYLSQHNVCQTLELMVKQLLRDRPDDPTLAICNMLRGGHGAHVNPLRNSGKSLQLPPPPTPTSELDERETFEATPTQPDGCKFPLPKARAGTTTTTNTATGQRRDQTGQSLSRGGSASQLVTNNVNPTVSPRNTSPTALGGNQQQPQSGTTVRPTSSSSAGSAYLRQKPGARSTSATPSQNTAGASSNSAYRREGGNPASLSAQGTGSTSTGTGHRTLERDESTKSEISTFSVNSVDMGEFIAEFRSAHHAVFPKGCEVISRNDLAEVVDRVALPLPDIRILADLFAEIDVTDCDIIKFDVFLARMCYKIQGRYQQEVLKGIFYSMIPGGHATHSKHQAAAAAANQQSSSSFHGSLTPGGNGGSTRGGMPPSISMTSLPDEAANYYPSVQHSQQSHQHVKGGQLPDPASGNHGAGLVEETCDVSVPRMQCLEEGLRAGLGLRVNTHEYNDACKRVGIPLAEDALVELADFLRLVSVFANGHNASSPSAGGGNTSGGGGYASGHPQLGTSTILNDDGVTA